MLTAGSDLMDSRMGTNRSTRPPRPVRPLPLRYTDDRPLPAPTLRDPLHSPGIPVSAPSLRLLFTAKMFFPTGATSESWLACFLPSPQSPPASAQGLVCRPAHPQAFLCTIPTRCLDWVWFVHSFPLLPDTDVSKAGSMDVPPTVPGKALLREEGTPCPRL